MLSAAKIQSNALGAERGLRFYLLVRVLFLLTGTVKDAGEIHIENHIRKVCGELSIRRRGEISSVQLVHDLIEQGIVILLHLGAGLAFLRSCAVQVE